MSRHSPLATERGTYQHPELYGLPMARQVSRPVMPRLAPEPEVSHPGE